VKPTQGVDFRAEFDAILNALARLEGAVAAQSIVIQRDVTEDYARSRE